MKLHREKTKTPLRREAMLMVDDRFPEPRLIARFGGTDYALRIHHPEDDRSLTIWWDGTVTSDSPSRP